jgi:hypothetical protein
VTAVQLQDLRDKAQAWASETEHTTGFVVLWQDGLAGWSVSRARLEQAGWLAGSVAIPIGIECSYAALVAAGGDYQNGCERWEEINA